MKRLLSLCLLLITYHTSAQILTGNSTVSYNADSVRAEIEKSPYFTLFKDNYLIGGIPLGYKPTSENSNMKFQLSIFQRLTKSKLPFDTYLFIQYSQKAFWNVFESSLPIHDLNFNPGIGIGHLMIHHNKYIGKGFLMFEHESNGKDGDDSRSWNRVSLGLDFVIKPNWDIQFKGWVPLIDGRHNPDLPEYCGIFQLASNLRTSNKRLNFGLVVVQREKWFDFNTQVELAYKLNRNENQYLFVQYYNGYGENLLDYNKYKSMLRIGFVIKPQDFSVY